VRNVRHEAGRTSRKNERECLKEKNESLQTNSENKNIRDLQRGITGLKKRYQPKTNTVKDENGDLADSRSFQLRIYASERMCPA
jgi:hypothetical protein